ncbi:hypothetical protein ACJJTC_011707 [Scirpophaga incertulas]
MYRSQTRRSEVLVYGRPRSVVIYDDKRVPSIAAAELLRAAAAVLVSATITRASVDNLSQLSKRAQVGCENMLFNDAFFNKSKPTVVLWYSTDTPKWENTIGLLNDTIIAAELQDTVKFMQGSDAALRRRISDTLWGNDSSILFLDYDLWADEPSVTPVVPPLCVQGNSSATSDSMPNCRFELNTTASFRAADFDALSQKAPLLLNLFYRFAPTTRQLREVLEVATNRSDSNLTEAACAWASDNTAVLNSWLLEEATDMYWIAVFLCDSDPSNKVYKRTAMAVRNYTKLAYEAKVKIRFISVDCSSNDELNNKFIDQTSGSGWPTLIGALASGAGAVAAAHNALTEETALVSYLPSPAAPMPPATYAAGGDLSDLALATTFFISRYKWKRLAVISEPTTFAKDFVTSLRRDAELIIQNVQLGDDPQAMPISVLRSLIIENARIFYLNVNSSTAATLLCAAHDLGMSSETIVWLLRDWPPETFNCTDSTWANIFTVSYRWRGETLKKEARKNADEKMVSLRNALYTVWKGTWPGGAVPLADGLLSLIRCFKTFKDKYGERLYDLHGSGTTRLLLKNLEDQNQEGILQELNYSGGAMASPYVFVHKWHGLQCEPIGQWRIVSGNVTVVQQQTANIFVSNIPGDGSLACYTYSHGDKFNPSCQDVIWFSTFCVIVMLVILMYVSRKVHLKQIARHDDILTAQLLAEDTAPKNQPIKLFDDSALHVYHEIGSGSYGFVRYGILRAPDSRAISVAVKQLDEGASIDSELLREAVMLASLDHENIVRLVGVCKSRGPLLILMEYAFFGDLKKYLWERRHLAECVASEDDDESDERVHISAEALTRLGCEAACALEYLAAHDIVHRDVRASNCMVDGRRVLKLGDFGLARRTELGARSEYVSQRRGLFPALWMAPESLERGVFTPAADAWALGVLLLELTTLGARPYGDWAPARVVRHVRAGGRPPLPTDLCPPATGLGISSFPRRRLLERCWCRAPGQRATAAEAARALSGAGAAVLRPALAGAGDAELRPALAGAGAADAPADADDSGGDEDGFTYYFG